jgi:hypothetical protein
VKVHRVGHEGPRKVSGLAILKEKKKKRTWPGRRARRWHDEGSMDGTRGNRMCRRGCGQRRWWWFEGKMGLVSKRCYSMQRVST